MSDAWRSGATASLERPRHSRARPSIHRNLAWTRRCLRVESVAPCMASPSCASASVHWPRANINWARVPVRVVQSARAALEVAIASMARPASSRRPLARSRRICWRSISRARVDVVMPCCLASARACSSAWLASPNRPNSVSVSARAVCHNTENVGARSAWSTMLRDRSSSANDASRRPNWRSVLASRTAAGSHSLWRSGDSSGQLSMVLRA